MLIVDGHVVDPATGLHEIADVLIEQDCIKKIYVRSRGEQADYNEAQENGHLVIDAKGKYVMPGFIDLHVHFRDPGLTYKEDIHTGAAAYDKLTEDGKCDDSLCDAKHKTGCR